MAAGLGEILVEQGVLTPEDLARAEAVANQSGTGLARSLVALGLVGEDDLVRTVAHKAGMEFVAVGPGTVEPSAARLIPRSVAQELTALPVRISERNELVVAVAEPGNSRAKRRIENETGLPVVLALASVGSLRQGIAHLTSDNGGAQEPVTAGAADGAGGAPEVVGANGRGAAEALDLPDLGGGDGSGAAVSGLVEAEEAPAIDLDELLSTLVDRGGSDLHLTTGLPPTIRVHGDLTPLDEFPVMKPDDLRKMLYAIMTQKNRQKFENQLELDMSYSIPGKARFRVNVFQQREAMGSVMRVIPHEILPLDVLKVPEQVANFAYLPRGFVLVTGPTGSGKSTTLAALVDLVNRNRPSHIMTVEDPIEFLHSHKRSVVNQREVGTDTHGFANALKHVLRQDPDVILVGEMRDLETIQIALTAAETGHLVFGTLHTQDAPQTVDRVIDVFPPHQQEQIRVQLAGALQGVVCQTLLKTPEGNGRVVAVEIMMATPAVRNLIREGKTHQIYSSIQAGAQHGMIAMDQSLAQLVKRNEVTYDAALEKCNNVQEFNRLAGRA